LKDALKAFDSTLHDAKKYVETDWRRQIEELTTFVAIDESKDLGMVRGVSSKADTSTALD